MISYIPDKVVCTFILDKYLYTTIGGADVHPRHNIKHDQMVRNKFELNRLQTKISWSFTKGTVTLKMGATAYIINFS